MASCHACTKCDAVFSTAQKLRRHEARKRPCDPIISVGGSQPNTCGYCGRHYSRKDALIRHLDSCRLNTDDKKYIAAQFRAMNTRFERELAALTKRIGDMEGKTNPEVEVNNPILNDIALSESPPIPNELPAFDILSLVINVPTDDCAYI
jgi:Zinc finger, C2H2 type